MNKRWQTFGRLGLIAVVVITTVLVPTSMASDMIENEVQIEAAKFLESYEKDYQEKYVLSALADWKAATTGSSEAFKAKAKAEFELKMLHSDRDRYRKIQALLTQASRLNVLTGRELTVAELSFKENQLPEETLKVLADMSAKIEQTFTTFRAEFGGKKLSNNELLEMLEKERDTTKRKLIWEALKSVGMAIAPDLIQLAKRRNEAARQLGYSNFWDMRIRLQEHDPDRIMALFGELEKLTAKPFIAMKKQLDGELAKRFKVKPTEIQAWHYDNPFFQAAPPSEKVDLDEFYKDKQAKDIVGLAQSYYADIGLPIEDIVARSDLYEREGKNQHAFSTDIDRNGDVRTLQNVRARAESMDTMLHEMGHGVYSKYIDRALPFNLRDSAHIFSTEGIAMLFGAQTSDPKWLVTYAGVDRKAAARAARGIQEQRVRELLIFARWTLVMLHFERALYENPTQDLNALWWDVVERFQKVPRPKLRNAPDWASKPHFTIAPVYYHNYMMGELFAAQLRHTLAKTKPGKAYGEFFKTKVFMPGMRLAWPEFVRQATGEELTARHFARDLGLGR